MIGITNDRNLYGAKVFGKFMDLKRAWPNSGGDPISADQVERNKYTISYRLRELQSELNNYLKDSEDPGKYEYYQNKVQNNKLRGTLRLLYVICSVSKEIIDNMIHVINNPDLYNDELRQTINEMASIWLGFYKNNTRNTLKRRLIDNATTYFTNPNLFLKKPAEPPEEPPVAPPMAPPMAPSQKPQVVIPEEPQWHPHRNHYRISLN